MKKVTWLKPVSNIGVVTTKNITSGSGIHKDEDGHFNMASDEERWIELVYSHLHLTMPRDRNIIK